MNSFARKLFAYVALSAFVVANSAPWAQASPQTPTSSMNLSSTVSSAHASKLLPSGVANIDVGGANLRVTPTTMLTPAEMVALSQVLTAGGQSIQIGALGNAVGGSFLMSAQSTQQIGNLVVPRGVTGVVNFAQSTSLNLAGNLSDSGSLYAVSTSQSLNGVAFGATNIAIGRGGLLSTIVPTGGLNGVSSPVGNLSLTLNASNNITNAGTISSAGSLSLNAGGTITNALPSGTSGAAPVIQAANDVNLTSGSGTFVNSGLIASQSGNVNFSTASSATALAVNNAGGSIQATNGSINVRDASYSGSANTSLTGGDWSSQQLNVNGGTGTVTVNVGQVSGQLNSVADSEHVSTDTPTLTLGNDSASGDPTYYNSGGDVDITGTVSASEGLVIAASGNIVGNSNSSIVNPGNNVTLIAGASITPCGTCSASTSLPGGTAVPSGSSISISAGNGGSIDFSASTAADVINTSSTTGAGGNVTLVAFYGSNVGSGIIKFPGGSSSFQLVNTAGESQSNGGNVLAIAGATSGTSFSAGSFETGGGSVSIYSATPSFSPSSISANSSGVISGTISPGAAQAGDIQITGEFGINTSSNQGTSGSVTISTATSNGIVIGGNNPGTGSFISEIYNTGIDNAHYGNVTIVDSGSAPVTFSGANFYGANISVSASNIGFANGAHIEAYGTSTTTPNGLITLTGVGDPLGMYIGGTGSTGFAVNNNVLGSIQAGTLLLRDGVQFNIQGSLNISGQPTNACCGVPTGNYNLIMLDTGTSAILVGNRWGIDMGSNSVTVVANGGILTGSGDGLYVSAFNYNANYQTTGNAGSITFVSAGNIGNTTGLMGLSAGSYQSTYNGGNITLVAGANNVTVAPDGSSIVIGPNTGSPTGGSVSLVNAGQALVTYGLNGGNITIAAFAGSAANSGQVFMPGTNLESGGYFGGSGRSGDVTIVAGAVSTSTSGNNSGYTIDTGGLGANYGVGNVNVMTATPSTPVTISTQSTAAGGGAIVSGTFLGGTIVDGAISVGNIGLTGDSSQVLARSPNNEIMLIAGSNATGTTANAISVGDVYVSNADVVMMTGAAGTANLSTNSYNLYAHSIYTSAGSIYLSSVDSITIGAQSNYNYSLETANGTVMVVAGISSTAGDITTGSAVASGGGNIIIASTGGAAGGGNISLGSTYIYEGSLQSGGGSVAVSSLNGTLNFAGVVGSYGNNANGDILLTSGSSASQSITVSSVITGEFSTTLFPGQIWVITANGSSSNVSNSTTTQAENISNTVTREANPVIATGTVGSISSGTTTMDFTPSSIPAGHPTGSITGFSPGGFTNISDSSGSVALNPYIGGNVIDNKLLVPIVSGGQISFGNNYGTVISVNNPVCCTSLGRPELAFIGATGVAIGTLPTYSVNFTNNGLGTYYASPAGGLTINQPNYLTVAGALINGAIFIGDSSAYANSVSSTGVQAAATTYKVYAVGEPAISFGASVYAPASISLNTNGSSTIYGDIVQTAGSLFTSQLTIAQGAPGASVGTSTNPLNTSAAQIIFTPGNVGMSAYIADSQSTSITNSSGFTFYFNNLSVTDNGFNGLLTVNTWQAGTLQLTTSLGSGAGIYYGGNLQGNTATIAADGSISGAAGAILTYPILNLTATNGNIGSVSNPVSFLGGSGVNLFASAGQNAYLVDSHSETVNLSNVTALTAGSSFNLVVNGSLTSANTASTAISSPNISLIAQGGSIGNGGTLCVSGIASGGLSIFAEATGASNTISLEDLSDEPVTIVNAAAPISASGSVLIVTNGTISAAVPNNIAISTSTATLTAYQGNIGSSSAPLVVSRGTASIPLAIGVVALSSSSGAGNIYLRDIDANPNGYVYAIAISGEAGNGPAADSTNGNFQLTTPNGGIALADTVSASTSITLNAYGGISSIGGDLAAPSMNLTSTTANIGGNGNPIIVTSGSAGPPVYLTTSAPSTLANTGNVYILDTTDSDVGGLPALILSGASSAGTGSSSAGNGVFSVVTQSGGIGVQGTVTAASDIILNSATAITAYSGNNLTSYQIDLTAAAGIGSTTQNLVFTQTGGVINITASDATAGKVYIQSTTNPISFGTVTVGNTLQITEPGDLTVSTFSGFSSIPNLGLVTTPGSGGNITIDANMSATSSIALSADGSVLNPSGYLLTAPNINLTATNGNIGLSGAPIFVSGNGSQLTITANAPANTANNGNVYITQNDGATAALVLGASSAGSGTAASNSGNLSVINENQANIVVNGPVTASNDISLDTGVSIVANSGSSLSAPTVDLYAYDGNIGSSSQSLVVTANTINVTSDSNSTNNQVYLAPTTTTFTLGAISISNLLQLTFSQAVGTSIFSSVGVGTSTAPNLGLATSVGSDANISVDTSFTATSSLTLIADGSIVQGGGNTLTAPTINLTATNGNIGASGGTGVIGNAISVNSGSSGTRSLTLTANAPSSVSGDGNIFVVDNETYGDTSIVAVNLPSVTGSAVSVITASGGIGITGTVTGTTNMVLIANGPISASGASPSVVGSVIYLSSVTGDIGESNAYIPFNNGGNNVAILVSAVNGHVFLSDSMAESVTLSNSANTHSIANSGFTLSADGSIVASADFLAISSSPISLTTTSGDISGPAGAPLKVQDGNGLTLQASAAGNVNIADSTAETVTLANFSTNTNYGGTSYTLTASGTIRALNASSMITSPTISLTSSNGNISGDGSTAQSLFVQSGNSNPLNLTVNAHNGFAGLEDDSQSINMSGASVAEVMQVNSTVGITIPQSASITANSALVNTPAITVDGTVTADGTGGTVVVTAPSGQDITVDGAGSLSGVNSIQFTASDTNSVTFAATAALNITGNTTITAPDGGIAIANGGSVSIAGNLNTNSQSFNQSGFSVTGSQVYYFPVGTHTVGTLINTTGNVVLGKTTIVNSAGENLVIIAAGNVIANGATTINLSGGSKSSGGNLTILAGYDFTPTSSGQVLNNSVGTVYTLSGANLNGGNIDLPKLTINTSSTASATGKNDSAGNVTMLASGGSVYAGTIVVGSITATSTNGSGGNVTLLGAGGVIVNGSINTSGKAAGGNVVLVGAQPIIAGSLQAQDGYMVGGLMTPGTPVANSGAAIDVTGSITTKSTAGAGGSVTMQADQQIVSGAITTSGLTNSLISGTAGGNVSITSLGSMVTVGTITTSSLNAASASAAGAAGSIDIQAGSLITTGSLIANGGNNAGGTTTSGNGGAGGSVSLETAQESIWVSAVSSVEENIGQITVKGYINTSGGNGSSTKGGNGGKAGSVSLAAGAVDVSGSTKGVSILASGGLAGKNGSAGSVETVNIETFANQSLPTALDLTSTTKNIAALPGAMFSVGLGATPNGVAGTIKADQTMTKTFGGNGEIIDTTNGALGAITVTVTGGSGSITETIAPSTTPSTPTINPLTGTKRTEITPSEALALFQVERNGGVQTLEITAPVGKGGAATGSTAAVGIPQIDVSGQSFTAFKLTPSVTLDFQGARPVVNLPSKASILGTIMFSTASSIDYINAGAGALTIGSSGAIDTSSDGGSTVVLSGTAGTWTNNGSIQADQLVIARPGSTPFSFVTGPGGNTTDETNASAQILLSPNFDAGMNMTFKANAADSFLPVSFGQLALPAMYTSNAQGIASSAAKLPAVSLTFSLSQEGTGAAAGTAVPLAATIGGTLSSAASLTIKGIANTTALPGSKTKYTNQTAIDVANGASFTAGVSTTDWNSIITNATVAPIQATAITTKGTISISSTAGGSAVTFGSQDVLTNNGTAITITATGTGGNINLGDNNTFTDIGGNIDILAKGNVTGSQVNSAAGNTFQAAGIVNTASGGIEIGAGTTASALSRGFGTSAPTTTATVPGATTPISGISNGVLLVLPSSTGINLATNQGGAGTSSTLDFVSHGVMVFQALNGGMVQMQNATFSTVSSKPISLVTPDQPVTEFIVDTDADFDTDGLSDDQPLDSRLTLK